MIPSFASSIGGSFILSLDLNKVSVDKRVSFNNLRIVISDYRYIIYSNRPRIYLTVFLILLASLVYLPFPCFPNLINICVCYFPSSVHAANKFWPKY